MMKFFRIDTLGDADNDKVAIIDDYVKGLEMDDALTKYGRPTAAAWPEDASIYLRKNSGAKLTDLLGTITNNLIVSSRLRACIASHCDGIAIEYLPIKLFDHRKRLRSEDYANIHPCTL
jgi:hypothetical protein